MSNHIHTNFVMTVFVVMLIFWVLTTVAGLLSLLIGLIFSDRRHSEQGCGKCGYLVKGLSGLNCPECGADLREVGIGKPGRSRRGFVVLGSVMIGLSFLFLIFIFILLAANA
ncbi:hypothetical protein [Poriferisphaera sp. WC338]|uniref:hypothetical protein n=1 Tax=Poriferisphaera sp. WC338 TaxID=3425129 RepID=UPI003D8196D5